MTSAGVFVAATRQHVGKTSTSLGLLQGLTNRYANIGYIKPVGQQSKLVNPESGLRVDKDCLVAKEIFNLTKCNYEDMSPVVIPAGYTRRYLDGEISFSGQMDKIHESYLNIASKNDFTVVEGTGHTGVGSIVEANNAQVAASLGLKMLLIANGGIGSAFDDLSLNWEMCQRHNVPICGVILNKVRPDKVSMLREYFPKALKRWNIPLLGVVPDLPALSRPSMMDFEELFQTELMSGTHRRFNQFDAKSLVTSGLRRFLSKLKSNEHNETLFVTHASRNDIVLGFISHAQNVEAKTNTQFNGGLILCGLPPEDQPQEYIRELIARSSVPILYVPKTTVSVMDAIANYTSKYNSHDRQRVLACAQHYEDHIDFQALVESIST